MVDAKSPPRKTSIEPHHRPANGDVASDQPRYIQVARELKRSISNGSYPVGAKLPTEAELCDRYGISRFTARAAVDQLMQAGLISRRKRAGTIVVATPSDGRYTHDLSTAQDLLQYTRDTELEVMYLGKITLSQEQAHEFGAEPGAEWIYVIGLRRALRAKARPISVARVFLNPSLEGIQAKLRDRKVKGPVYELIERDFHRRIERIEQEMQGTVLSAEDAANLGSEPGSPALRIVRRFYGDDGELLEFADNVHPSDRFVYRMQLRK